MRETVGIPAGILVYFVATIISLIVVQVAVATPREWSTFITASIAVVSFEITCAAVKNFSNETGVKIVGVMIALFWLVSLGVDVFSGLNSIMNFLGGGQGSAEPKIFEGFVRDVWNTKISAGVSVVLALWTLGR
ncbi:MAG: hypothetical protein IJL12_01170 [Selenomonadaceae bacterium]|nr:hypothetical protein [Selenomonadaceae bacterium]